MKGVNMFVQRAEANFGGFGHPAECKESRFLQQNGWPSVCRMKYELQ